VSLSNASPPPGDEAGWYPDPLGGSRWRYYDGVRWSDKVSRSAPQEQGPGADIGAHPLRPQPPINEPVESGGGNWWSRRPRWAQWTIGVVAALVILFVGVAIGGSASKEGELKDEIAALEREQTEGKEQAEEEVGEAQADVKASELEAEAEAAKESELIAAGEARAKKIVGAAEKERDQLAGKVTEQEAELSSISGEVGAVESKLSNLRGEVGGAEEVAAKSTIPGDGTFEAEVDYIPGTYKAPGGNLCYWATLGSPDTFDIEDNENGEGPQIAEITSPYFQTKGCGEWTRVE
jgi:hypothetical protein